MQISVEPIEQTPMTCGLQPAPKQMDISRNSLGTFEESIVNNGQRCRRAESGREMRRAPLLHVDDRNVLSNFSKYKEGEYAPFARVCCVLNYDCHLGK